MPTAYDVAFVDSIVAAPTVRLNLHSSSGGWACLAEGTEFAAPPFDRVLAESMMADGGTVSSSVYRNRTITLSLELPMDLDPGVAATLLQSLVREIDRPGGNILRYRADTTTPVFFRTLRSGPDALQWNPFTRRARVSLMAKPFGYGPEETLSPATVTNNPAAGSNGMFFDITSPKGDVETPLNIAFTNGTTGLGQTGRVRSALAVRRRGTVSAVPFFLQAESMTMGTDTTVQANNVAFSGTGLNFVKSVIVTASMVTRLSTTTRFPTSASTDARGTYRVFVRVRQNTSADVWDVRLLHGSTSVQVTGDTVRLPPDTGPSFPTLKYIDLGKIQIPLGYDPVYDEATGVELSTEGVFLAFQAQRVSGSGSLDTDVFLFVPADDRFEFIKWPTTQAFSTDVFVATGGETPAAYCLKSTGEITSTESIEIDGGGGLMITPGRTNRVFFIRDVGTGTAQTGTGDSITATNVLTASYQPRYVFEIKPDAT